MLFLFQNLTQSAVFVFSCHVSSVCYDLQLFLRLSLFFLSGTSQVNWGMSLELGIFDVFPHNRIPMMYRFLERVPWMSSALLVTSVEGISPFLRTTALVIRDGTRMERAWSIQPQNTLQGTSTGNREGWWEASNGTPSFPANLSELRVKRQTFYSRFLHWLVSREGN